MRSGRSRIVVRTAGIRAGADGLVRIPSSRLDELMDLVSELIARRRLWSAQAESIKIDRGHGPDLRAADAATPRAAARGRARAEGRDGTPGRRLRADVPGQLRRLDELADDLAVLADTARAAGDPLADHGGCSARL